MGLANDNFKRVIEDARGDINKKKEVEEIIEKKISHSSEKPNKDRYQASLNYLDLTGEVNANLKDFNRLVTGQKGFLPGQLKICNLVRDWFKTAKDYYKCRSDFYFYLTQEQQKRAMLLKKKLLDIEKKLEQQMYYQEQDGDLKNEMRRKTG